MKINYVIRSMMIIPMFFLLVGITSTEAAERQVQLLVPGCSA